MFGDGHLGTMAGAQDACGKAEWIVEGLKAVMEKGNHNTQGQWF